MNEIFDLLLRAGAQSAEEVACSDEYLFIDVSTKSLGEIIGSGLLDDPTVLVEDLGYDAVISFNLPAGFSSSGRTPKTAILGVNLT